MNSLVSPKDIDLTTRVKCGEAQIAVELAGELAIKNLKTGVHYGLDEVGKRIWNLLTEDRTVQEICDQLLDEYAVDAQRCEQDLLRLLSELARHELVKLTRPSERTV